MSIMVIDRRTYDAMLNKTVAEYIDKGLDLCAARQMARDVMRNCFQTFEQEAQRDCQHDHDLQREEMQMTPGEHRAWRDGEHRP